MEAVRRDRSAGSESKVAPGAGLKRFSLIELLVVVAIMAILMSLLFPALSKSKAVAVRVSCAGGCMKSLFSSMSMYNDDNNEYFTPYLYNSPHIYWADLLTPYVGGHTPVPGVDPATYFFDCSPAPEAFLCPKAYSASGKKAFSTAYLGIGYSNWGLGNGVWSRIIRRSQIKQHSQILLFADSTGSTGSPLSGLAGGEHFIYSYFRHSGFINATFCDGHVEPEKNGWVVVDWTHLFTYPWMEPGW